MPTEVYAKIVVTEVLKPKPRAWLWTGNQASLVWLMDTFLGRRGFVSIPKAVNLNLLLRMQPWPYRIG